MPDRAPHRWPRFSVGTVVVAARRVRKAERFVGDRARNEVEIGGASPRMLRLVAKTTGAVPASRKIWYPKGAPAQIFLDAGADPVVRAGTPRGPNNVVSQHDGDQGAAC